MLTLGELLALSRSAPGDLDRLGLPPGVLSAVRAAAAAEGITPERFLRRAVDWTTLMSELRDGQDPGAACLRRMVERRLAGASQAPAPADSAEEDHADVRREPAAKARPARPGA